MSDITNLEQPKSDQKVQLYDPHQYMFIGFFLSLLPVFFMSYKNCSVLPNAEGLRERMKIFALCFAAIFVFHTALVGWAAYSTAVSFKAELGTAIKTDPARVIRVVYQGGVGIEKITPTAGRFEGKVLRNANPFFFVLNLFLLILVTRYTSKNEVPIYNELKSKGALHSKRLLVPVLIGIIFVALIFQSDKLLVPLIIRSVLS